MSAADATRYVPLRELGRRVRQGELTAEALAEATLALLERQGPAYNAVVTLTRERALAEARQADADLKAGHLRGALHGLPWGAKDLLATAGGIPTSWGFGALKDQQFDDDAAVVASLAGAGAVLAAKLAMVELAGGMRYNQPHASFTGPGRNPWNVDAWTGGSSAGSGAAVAAGLVPFAIGTETFGSIIGPAGFCGITGLRPTLGRVSRRGAMALSWTLDKIGPMGLTADCCGLVLEAIAGPDVADEHTLQAPFRYSAAGLPKRKLTLRVLPGEEVSGQPAIAENFRAALAAFKPIADIEEVPLPDYPYVDVTMSILAAESAAALGDVMTEERCQALTAPESRGTMAANKTLPAKQYLHALQTRQRWHTELNRWLAGCDAVLVPSAKKVAPGIDDRFSAYFGSDHRMGIAALGNLLGWPALTMPNGFGERGLPTGLQLVGPNGSENLLLALGNHYQQHTDWHRQHPPDAAA